MKAYDPGVQCSTRIEELEVENLASYALRSAERRPELGEQFRERAPEAPLEYRSEYHRDRDRIVWSTAFRRLQNKTQVFPHYAEDHYRRRLTHSMEVAQIATTLARGLRVNETATEAIALGHDLGHCPFGHAGEHELNKCLYSKVSGPEFVFATAVPLYGFDHCSQGIEVVSRWCAPRKLVQAL